MRRSNTLTQRKTLLRDPLMPLCLLMRSLHLSAKKARSKMTCHSPLSLLLEEVASANKDAPLLSSSLAPHVLVELPTNPLEKEPPRIDISLPSPKHQWKRPGPLNLRATIDTNIPPPLPSALATALHIEDINRITYPSGYQEPQS